MTGIPCPLNPAAMYLLPEMVVLLLLSDLKGEVGVEGVEGEVGGGEGGKCSVARLGMRPM